MVPQRCRVVVLVLLQTVVVGGLVVEEVFVFDLDLLVVWVCESEVDDLV